jgi:hypothetical protein
MGNPRIFVLLAVLAVLISLHAATVQAAQQTLMAASLLPVMLLKMVLLLLVNVI